MHLKTNISLLPYHTFGIDVRSKYLVEAKTIDELKQILSEQQDQKILILGGGSNVLFTKHWF